MGLIIQQDFSAGFCPSDDIHNARPNCLLRMDNCFLDNQGALNSVRGTTKINSSTFAAPLSYLYSKTMGAFVYRYVATNGGAIFRDKSTGDFSGAVTLPTGSQPRTCFGCAFGFVLYTNGTTRIKDDTSGTTRNLGIAAPGAAPTTATGAAGNLTGTYTYIQVNAAELAQYIGQSPGSVVSASVSPSAQQVTVTPYTTGVDAQVTHYYFFRLGGTLNTYYFVGKVAVGAGAFTDNVTDQTALLINIQLNQFLASIGALSDEILSMAGPVAGRMLYMTYKQIIISEPFNIDSYDTRKVIQLSSASGTTGKNLFLAQYPIGITYAGTTEDIYEITGTLSDLSDGTMDINIRAYGLQQPPICETFTVGNSTLFYVGNDGIRALNGSQSILISGELNALWRTPDVGRTTRFGLSVFLIKAANTVPYRLCVNQNKLYCALPALSNNLFSLYVYDLRKNYWYFYGIDPAFMFTEEDGTFLGGFGDGGVGNLYKLDDPNAFTFGGSSFGMNLIFPLSRQEINQRKDAYQLRLHVNTGGAVVDAYLNIDGTNNTDDPSVFPPGAIFLGHITTAAVTEVILNISSAKTGSGFPATLNKRYSIQLVSSGLIGSFSLLDWSIDYDTRPEPLNYLRVPPSQFQIAGRKRISEIPFVIDTLGNSVAVQAVLDNVVQSAQNFTTSNKTKVNYLLSSNTLATDIGLLLSATGTNVFEFYDMLPPRVQEMLPDPVNFYQMPSTNYGIPGKKRIRALPFVINTLGQDVLITPIIDGITYTSQIFNTAEKTTVFYYFNTDIFGTDVVVTVAGKNVGQVFEFYEALSPVNVETLPVGKLFDQIGPFELERIGALLEFRVRMVATSSSITYNVYMDDVVLVSNGSFSVTPNVDKSYGPIKVPKGIQGSVCRIELSSTSPFYRWNCKPKFTIGGIKSDTKQMVIADPVMGRQN